MTWFKEAVERRTVSSFFITSSPVQAKIVCQLMNEGLPVGPEKTFENWKARKKKIVNQNVRWDLFSEETAWDQLSLKVQLSIEISLEFDGVPILFGMDAICRNTRWRKAATCPFDSHSTLTLTISRNDVAGQVLLTPFVMHAGGDGSVLKGKRLAGGFPFVFLVDPPGDQFGSGIEVKWDRFPEDVQDSLYYLDLDGDVPVLLINKGLAGLKTIFEDRSRAGHRARLRNSLFSFIAVDVWSQLAQFAGEIERLDLDDDMDPKVLLSRKAIRSLMKMLKLREEEIVQASQDAGTRSELNRRLQHYFTLASFQDELVSRWSPDETEETT